MFLSLIFYVVYQIVFQLFVKCGCVKILTIVACNRAVPLKVRHETAK